VCSEKATCKLLTPATYNLAADGYDLLGVLLLSDDVSAARYTRHTVAHLPNPPPPRHAARP